MSCSKFDALCAIFDDDPNLLRSYLQGLTTKLAGFTGCWRQALADGDYGELTRLGHDTPALLVTVRSLLGVEPVPELREIFSMNYFGRTLVGPERERLIRLFETADQRLKSIQSKLERWVQEIHSHGEFSTIKELKEILEEPS